MKLPTQAKSVDRANRIGEAKAANVSPAFWGGALDILKKGLGAVNSVVNG